MVTTPIPVKEGTGLGDVIKTITGKIGFKHCASYEKCAQILIRPGYNCQASVRKWLKRRSAIEAVIGHAKTDGRLGRNYLIGKEGDKINAILSGCGYNIRKLLKALLFYLFFCRQRSLSTI